MLDKNTVMQFVQENGPCIPRDLVRELGTDTMLVGAVLSQLVDAKRMKLSHTKIGGSPVYYVDGQEEKLQDLYDHLKHMEKKAYDLLKEKKILRDRSAEPAIRVALRNIRDFAKALEVNMKGEREIFWKWYLYPNEQAEKDIRQMLKNIYGSQERKEVPKEPEPAPEKTESKEHKDAPKEKKPESPDKQDKPETKKEEQKRLDDEDEPEDELLSLITKEFDKRDIEILESEVVRKGTDVELVIRMPSAVGKLTYFCKVRDKQRSSDKDLSSAYVKAQMKKLPVLFVTTGDLTKKAKKMLDSEFKMIAVLQI